MNGERKHQTGMLEALGVNADDANAIIMAARVVAGWIEAPVVVAAPEEPAADAVAAETEE